MKEGYTVVFLVDKVPNPEKVLMLKRAMWKKFAPGWYTGVGGKIENEAPMAGAVREMGEKIGVEGLELNLFGICVIPELGREIYYYWADGSVHQSAVLSCNEGELEWCSILDLVRLRIIPTTAMVINEWLKRGMLASKPFSLFAGVVPGDDLAREFIRIEEGVNVNEVGE